MEAAYFIMRKNDIVTLAFFDDSGQMLKYSDEIQTDIAPIQSRYKNNWLKDWWSDRAVPISQDNIKRILTDNNCAIPSEYLIKNLGLSLTDHYWIKPMESDLTWEQVNLFDNDFTSNMQMSSQKHSPGAKTPNYSPNGSLQGNIEKTWAIINNERCLIKGNRTYLSQESLNEVIASEIHKRQGYDNYTSFIPIRIKSRPYKYGCCSKAFTSQEKELVSAYALFSSEKKPNAVSNFKHLMNMCKANGLDIEQFQYDMDYQIITDFVMSQYDRHLNNFGIIRDADSLGLKRLAPIYDSGGCLFANKEIPRTAKALLSIKSSGLTEKELAMLKYVKNKDVVDLTKLPATSFIRKTYEKDDKMNKDNIEQICYLYEKKIDICKAWQDGIDPLKKQYAVSNPSKQKRELPKDGERLLKELEEIHNTDNPENKYSD